MYQGAEHVSLKSAKEAVDALLESTEEARKTFAEAAAEKANKSEEIR